MSSSSGDVGSMLMILVGVVTLEPPSASDRDDRRDDEAGVGIWTSSSSPIVSLELRLELLDPPEQEKALLSKLFT